MTPISMVLEELVGKLLSHGQSDTACRIAKAEPLDFGALVEFDAALGWACMTNVNAGKTGGYDMRDRDVFRPLQYCATYLQLMSEGKGGWLTRETVHMAGLHIESLSERIGLSYRSPLGRSIRSKVFRQNVDEETWKLIDKFRHIYNIAKHDVSHDKDTHMFTVADAVLAYIVCRAIGNRLSHLAKLKTEWVETVTSPDLPANR